MGWVAWLLLRLCGWAWCAALAAVVPCELLLAPPAAVAGQLGPVVSAPCVTTGAPPSPSPPSCSSACPLLPAEPNVVALYEKLGYVADPDGIRGVAYQRSKLAKSLAQGLLQRR